MSRSKAALRRAASTVWAFRKPGSPTNGYVTVEDEGRVVRIEYVTEYGSSTIYVLRRDARLLIRRLEEALKATS